MEKPGPLDVGAILCYYVRDMAKVAPEIKERLLAEGKWQDFTRVREDGVLRGLSPVAAMREAISQFCPDLASVPMPSHKRGRPKGSKTAKSDVVGGVQVAVADPSMFEGKECSMVRAFDWIIDALAVPPSEVRPETAPAAKAWSLYLMCLKSPSFAADMISKAVVRQIPNGARDDDNGGQAFDGEREYDILAAISAGGGAAK